MLKNYLLVALRTLKRQRAFALINVTGLAVGLACCLLILLYVRDELSYDRHHTRAEHVARLTRTSSALSAGPMGPALVRDLPGVEHAARITGDTRAGIRRDDGEVFSESILFVDSSFVDIFTVEFLRGDPATALHRPDALLLTESAARRYFDDADPMGRPLTVQLEEQLELTVTGVVADPPRASHFRYDLLASFEPVARASQRMENWHTNWLFTYMLLAEGTDAADVEAALPAFFERHVGEEWTHFGIQSLLDVHLRSAHLEYDIAPQGNIAYVLLFSAVAALILLIACINFVNLSTARSLKRAKEVGARKVFGARRSQLVAQFLGEAVLLAVLALALAGWLVSLLLPFFRDLAGRDLVLTVNDVGPGLGMALVLILVVGVVAGSYPAFVLSRFRPAAALRGQSGGMGGRGWMRRGLVAFQFAVSLFLIVGTLVVDRQLGFLREARLGYDGDQVLAIDFGDALDGRYEAVKREVLRHPNVLGASASDNVPGEGVSDFLYRPEGWTEADMPGWDTYFVDADYMEVLGMEIARGRGFRPDVSPEAAGFVINETALRDIVAAVGDVWEDPIGRQIEFYVPGAEGWQVLRQGPVVGVVKDFHYRSLHAEIGPLVMQVLPGVFDVLLVDVRTDGLDETLAFLEDQWEAFGPDRPFEYAFLDEAYDRLYQNEAHMGTLFSVFAGLAVLVACLGLFGLAAYTAERRTKEIGVRKVLGASVTDIVLLLSKEFVVLVVVAFVVAAPLVWLAMERWLNNFAYRAEWGLDLLALAGGLGLAIALLTVSAQAIRAALTDPVESLRYE